jgi:hypothetical protein
LKKISPLNNGPKLIFMVREARFELAQGCPRQPLKLVRLPFRHSRKKSKKYKVLCEEKLNLHNYRINPKKTQSFFGRWPFVRHFLSEKCPPQDQT